MLSEKFLIHLLCLCKISKAAEQKMSTSILCSCYDTNKFLLADAAIKVDVTIISISIFDSLMFRASYDSESETSMSEPARKTFTKMLQPKTRVSEDVGDFFEHDIRQIKDGCRQNSGAKHMEPFCM